MNRKQYHDEMNRRFLERMADASFIEVTKTVDSVGYVRWQARCYATGRGRTEFIGGLSNASYEAAVAAAHEYATLTGSLTLSEALS